MINVDHMQSSIQSVLKNQYHTNIRRANFYQLHNGVSQAVMGEIVDDWQSYQSKSEKGRMASYFSAEFLVGRLIYNNLLCLGMINQVDGFLKDKGSSLAVMEEVEDAALGNGGLGRLAACFLDSAATMGIPLNGYGIRYKYGIFKQNIVDGFQSESADDWTRFGDPWSIRRAKESFRVKFSDQEVVAVPYDMPIIGYNSNTIGTLRLWQSEPLTPFDFNLFNQQQYDASVEEKNRAEDISRVLYPNDDNNEGKVLRLKQEYFFCSASIQDLLRRYKRNHGLDLREFAKYNAVQLNDTHPIIAIPELIRLLVEDNGLDFYDAFEITRKVFNYTNHTMMQEALETWQLDMLESVIPNVCKYIYMIDDELIKELNEKKVGQDIIQQIRIVRHGQVHMADMAIFCCSKINGVAQLHSQLIQRTLFNKWYNIYPDRFLNKTNGVTQRRWISLCNPELAAMFTQMLDSEDWIVDLPQLANLEKYADDTDTLRRLMDIKHNNKIKLANMLKIKHGILINPDTIFDTQIKRLHEYKRQLLNILTILELYFRIKEGSLRDFAPTTFFFGAKSAPGYYMAKGVIKLINEVGRLINSDPQVRDIIRVVFIPNYNVSKAEYIIAATDVSQQISTAGTEASGTGNMKFMMNGAVTLGTYDGANVEIVGEAGRENNYIFGAEVQQLNEIAASYNPREYYENNPSIKRTIDALINGTVSDGDTGVFRDIYNSLVNSGNNRGDNYYLLLDFEDYINTRIRVNNDYKNSMDFARKCWINICRSGKFSSDRTVKEYADEIWHV